MILPVAILLAQAGNPYPVPQSAYLNDAMRQCRSLAESTAAGGALLTVAEKSNYRNTGNYAEAVAFYRALEKASPYAKLTVIGQTGEGRDLYALIVSKDRAFTAAAARRTAKPVVLLQNGIHAGENGGKDAAMMLLRDVLVSKKLAAWLDRVILISIPVFNADGHERVSPFNRINENGPDRMGFRVTGQRLNLNRDYLKADTPEMRAFLALYTAWLPDFFVDNHVTDGSDNQYDVTIATHTEQDIAAPVGRWVNDVYLPAMMRAMEENGHVIGWYGGGPGLRAGARIPVMTASPRYSTGYAASQNRASLLVETHSLKPFRVRVWSHYDIMRASIDAVAASSAALHGASLAADRAMEQTKPGDRVFLEGVPGEKGEPYVARLLEVERYAGSAAGGPITRYTSRPSNLDVTLVRSLVSKVEPAAPLGYIVPRPWTAVAAVLALHGVRSEPISKAFTAELDVTRLSNGRFAAAPFEGRVQVASFDAVPARIPVAVPAGSLFIPVAQRAGKVAMHFLEPAAPDSAVRWGFFDAIFEQKEYFSDYIFEPIAEEMLRRDPQLKAAFDAELARNPDMARNPRARLTWLYQRSPYLEPDKEVYPILRIDRKTW